MLFSLFTDFKIIMHTLMHDYGSAIRVLPVQAHSEVVGSSC